MSFPTLRKFTIYRRERWNNKFMKIQYYSIKVAVKMDNYSENREEQSKKSCENQNKSKFEVKINKKTVSIKFHQPFKVIDNTKAKKFREGQKSRRIVAKNCKFNNIICLRNFRWRYNNHEIVPWIR